MATGDRPDRATFVEYLRTVPEFEVERNTSASRDLDFDQTASNQPAAPSAMMRGQMVVERLRGGGDFDMTTGEIIDMMRGSRPDEL